MGLNFRKRSETKYVIIVVRAATVAPSVGFCRNSPESGTLKQDIQDRVRTSFQAFFAGFFEGVIITPNLPAC